MEMSIHSGTSNRFESAQPSSLLSDFVCFRNDFLWYADYTFRPYIITWISPDYIDMSQSYYPLFPATITAQILSILNLIFHIEGLQSRNIPYPQDAYSQLSMFLLFPDLRSRV